MRGACQGWEGLIETVLSSGSLGTERAVYLGLVNELLAPRDASAVTSARAGSPFEYSPGDIEAWNRAAPLINTLIDSGVLSQGMQ